MSETPSSPAYPPRLRLLIAGALTLAVPVVAGAVVSMLVEPPGTAGGLAIALFLGLALLAELKPVPLEEDDLSTVSLAFVFILAGVILFGWDAGVLIAAVSASAAQVAERKPLVRILFNTAVYSLSAFAAALPVLLLGPTAEHDPLAITLAALVGGAAFVAVNFAFISLAISFHQETPVLPLLKEELRLVGPAFAIQAFLAALAAALWATDARLLVLMAGPLFTVTLYQRSSLASRRATRDSLTDSLTGIGNNRAYETTLAGALDHATGTATRMTLCLVDVDDFKQINDTFGHPLGDRVLVEVAEHLATQTDCIGTFRFGGDEFAVLLTCGKAVARSHVEALYRSLSEAEFSHGTVATVSVGTATFPDDAADSHSARARGGRGALLGEAARQEPLVRLQRGYRPADRPGRARAPHRIPDPPASGREPHSRGRREGRVHGSPLRAGRAPRRGDRAAARLRRAAGRAAEARRPAPRPRQDRDPRPRAAEARQPDVRGERQLAHHPELGASLLDGMDIRPVDVWIRHHHEHWDGSGYPHGLAGEEIPFGSRLILVADAYDAITTERSYREAATPDEAMAEIRGTRRPPVRPDRRRCAAGVPRGVGPARRPRREPSSSSTARSRSAVSLVFPVLLAVALGLALGGRLGALAELELRAPLALPRGDRASARRLPRRGSALAHGRHGGDGALARLVRAPRRRRGPQPPDHRRARGRARDGPEPRRDPREPRDDARPLRSHARSGADRRGAGELDGALEPASCPG